MNDTEDLFVKEVTPIYKGPELVISGGQTGADFGGLLAARECGIATGGWAPRGYRTENGVNYTLKEYGLKEHTSKAYPPRTEDNVKWGDVTLLLRDDIGSSGSKLTIKLCEKHGKHILVPTEGGTIGLITMFLATHKPKVLNIAGNRESLSPGMTKATFNVLVEVFKGLRSEELPGETNE